MTYLVEVPSRAGAQIRFKRELEDPNWPVMEISLARFFKDWPDLAPRYQANMEPIDQWSAEKLAGIEAFLLEGEAVFMPRLSSANLVDFPWWDLRRYSKQEFTTVTFTNGRHRMTWMHANGVLHAPVQIPARYTGILMRRYEGQVLWPVPAPANV